MSAVFTTQEWLAMPDQRFACSFGHVMTARSAAGAPQDLTGYFCAICMGAIVGAEKIIDPRILAPVQEG